MAGLHVGHHCCYWAGWYMGMAQQMQMADTLPNCSVLDCLMQNSFVVPLDVPQRGVTF